MPIDIAKLSGNVRETEARLRADPDEGHVRPLVRTSLVEDVHSESHFVQYAREFSFASDESEGRAGRGLAPSPLRYFLSGLAFCQQVWYAKGAALADLQLDALEIDVHTYMDMRGEHLIDGIAAHPQWVVVHVRARTPGSPAQVLAAAEEANNRCPVYNLVVKAIPVYTRIDHNGSVIRDDVPPDLAPAL